MYFVCITTTFNKPLNSSINADKCIESIDDCKSFSLSILCVHNEFLFIVLNAYVIRVEMCQRCS